MASERAGSQSQAVDVNFEKKFIDAKAYLQTVSSKTGTNVLVLNFFLFILK